MPLRGPLPRNPFAGLFGSNRAKTPQEELDEKRKAATATAPHPWSSPPRAAAPVFGRPSPLPVNPSGVSATGYAMPPSPAPSVGGWDQVVQGWNQQDVQGAAQPPLTPMQQLMGMTEGMDRAPGWLGRAEATNRAGGFQPNPRYAGNTGGAPGAGSSPGGPWSRDAIAGRFWGPDGAPVAVGSQTAQTNADFDNSVRSQLDLMLASATRGREQAGQRLADVEGQLAGGGGPWDVTNAMADAGRRARAARYPFLPDVSVPPVQPAQPSPFDVGAQAMQDAARQVGPAFGTHGGTKPWREASPGMSAADYLDQATQSRDAAMRGDAPAAATTWPGAWRGTGGTPMSDEQRASVGERSARGFLPEGEAARRRELIEARASGRSPFEVQVERGERPVTAEQWGAMGKPEMTADYQRRQIEGALITAISQATTPEGAAALTNRLDELQQGGGGPWGGGAAPAPDGTKPITAGKNIAADADYAEGLAPQRKGQVTSFAKYLQEKQYAWPAIRQEGIRRFGAQRWEQYETERARAGYNPAKLWPGWE